MYRLFMSVLGLFMAIGLMTSIQMQRAHAVTSELFVINPTTGIAIYGYDPVAYFTDQQAREGDKEYEVEWRDNYWRFVNAANRERFQEAPEVYRPCFNGYGAFSIAAGRLAEGNPLIWAIYENRLFFFHSVEARSKWVKDPAGFLSSGLVNWPNLRRTLTR